MGPSDLGPFKLEPFHIGPFDLGSFEQNAGKGSSCKIIRIMSNFSSNLKWA